MVNKISNAFRILLMLTCWYRLDVTSLMNNEAGIVPASMIRITGSQSDNNNTGSDNSGADNDGHDKGNKYMVKSKILEINAKLGSIRDFPADILTRLKRALSTYPEYIVRNRSEMLHTSSFLQDFLEEAITVSTGTAPILPLLTMICNDMTLKHMASSPAYAYLNNARYAMEASAPPIRPTRKILPISRRQRKQ